MKLQVANDEGSVTEYEFAEDVLTIGRLPKNTIQLPDRNVSREHLRLVREDGETFVEDLGSSFGIRLNGNRVDARTKILPGDRIKVGDYTLRIALNPGEVTAEIELKDGEGGDRIAGGVQGHLVLLNGPDEGAAFPLDQTSMLIGRGDHNTIVVQGRGVAEVHAELRWDGQSFEIEEINGDVVVNNLLVESAYLTSEDQIELGELQFSLRLPETPDPILAETRPAAEWDPQTSPTIQGDASMLDTGTENARWWLIPLLAIALVGTIAVWLMVPNDPELTHLQKELTESGPVSVEPTKVAALPEREVGAAPPAERAEDTERRKTLEERKGLATEAMVTRKWDEAITLFQGILDEVPDDADSKQKLAQAEMEERRLELVNELEVMVAKRDWLKSWERARNSAIKVPEESVYFPVFSSLMKKVEPETQSILLKTAREALDQGRNGIALKLARDANSISKSAEAKEVLREAKAAVNADRKKAKKAARAKAKAEQDANPRWKELYEEGRDAKRNGNNTLAIVKFKESIQAKKTAKATKMLGILYAVQGDKASAVKYYKSYLQLAPGAKDAETVRTVIKRLGGTL